MADIGGLISCKVFFDSAGRSKVSVLPDSSALEMAFFTYKIFYQGEAEIVFTTLQQAKSAIERYNER